MRASMQEQGRNIVGGAHEPLALRRPGHAGSVLTRTRRKEILLGENRELKYIIISIR